MFIKLKDNSPVPSCAIWLGNSLIKPAEEAGAQIYNWDLGEFFTRKDNTFICYDSDAYYNTRRLKLYVKNFKGEPINLKWAITDNGGDDQIVMIGKWDDEITNPMYWDESQWQGVYHCNEVSEASIPAPEDSGEHSLEIFYYEGYYGRRATFNFYPASLFADLTVRYTADGYIQEYEDEHYKRYVNLAEEIQQSDGSWKKDGYTKEGELDYEYEGKVYAYWSDPYLQATANGKKTNAPIEQPVSSLAFDSGITKLDYIDENIPLKTGKAMFKKCGKLTSIPNFSVSGITDAEQMFYNCSGITELPEFDFADGANMFETFSYMKKIKKIKLKKNCKITECNSLFEGDNELEKIENIDFQNCMFVSSLFSFCFNLYDIPVLNFTNAFYAVSTFYANYYLSDFIFQGQFNCDINFNTTPNPYDGYKALTQRTIKSIIDTLQVSTKTGLTITMDQSLLIDDADGTYAAKIADITSKGNNVAGLQLVSEDEINGWKFTNDSGKLPNYDFILTYAYTDSSNISFKNPLRSLQKDGKEGMYLWTGETTGVQVSWSNNMKSKNIDIASFDGFIKKTKWQRFFKIRGTNNLKRVDMTNVDFSGTTITDTIINDINNDTEVLNLDLSGAIINAGGDLINGSETKKVLFTGSIDNGFNFNVGWSLSKESIISMLTACCKTTNTDAKKICNGTTLTYIDDSADTLANLVAQATSKGWTFEGIKIVPFSDLITLNYTTTDGKIPQKFIDWNGQVDTSEYGKFRIMQQENPKNFDINWDNIETLKTFDGADKELKCRGVNMPYCRNLEHADYQNIKFYSDGSGYNPELLRSDEKLEYVRNLDYSNYSNEEIGSILSECWGLSELAFAGHLNCSRIDIRDAGQNLSYDSIKSILNACIATTEAEKSKTFVMGDRTMIDNDGDLAGLVAQATSKGWTFEGLTIN